MNVAGVNRTQARILIFLIGNEKSGIKNLGKKLNLDRSTIEKNIKYLMKMGLVSRIQENRKRGYRYVYSCLCRDELKKRLKRRIEEICKDMGNIFKNL